MKNHIATESTGWADDKRNPGGPHSSTTPPAPDQTFRPAESGPVKRYELYFGLGRSDGSVVSASDWELFEKHDLRSCFPQGYTVLGGTGGWRSPSGRWCREPVKVVVLYVPKREPLFGVTLAALALCWKRFASQEAVLAVESTATAVQL